MQASVIIPHYNDTVRLEKCLKVLEPQVAGKAIEIIVGDNASTHDLSQVKAAFPDVRFVHAPNPGAAEARNCAIAQSNGEWLFFIDADCVADEDWIDVALRVKNPDKVIGGRVTVFDETPPPRSGAEAFEHVFAFPMESYIVKKNYAGAGNMVISRAVFDHVGPFDGSKAEDMDWGQRAHGLGYAIEYAPELIVAHPTRPDWASLLRKWRRISSENYFAHGTSPVQRLTWGLRCIVIVGSIPVHTLKILRHRELTATDKLVAFGTLLRLRTLRVGWTLRQAIFGDRPINVPKTETAQS